MSGRAAFGPNLRRARIHYGVSLETIARETKVPLALWEGLEDNNFAGWPRGIYARAYVREYAQLIGVDPDEAVNEFCRVFPEGDRRQVQLLSEHAQIVGHQLAWTDDLPTATDRRAPASVAPPRPGVAAMRLAAVVVDCSVVLGFALVAGVVVSLPLAARMLAGTAVYYAVHVVAGGKTPAFRLIDAYFDRADSRELFARRVRGRFRFGKRSEDASSGLP